MAENRTQDLITITNVLKEQYLPYINNMLNIQPSPFLEKIKKSPLEANEMAFGARIGIGGGYGASEERQPTPAAFAPIYKRFRATSKDMYVDIQISEKTLRLGRTNRQSMVDALNDELEASAQAANWNMGRMLFGDGKGILATIQAAVTTSSPTITVDSVDKLKIGLVVDLYAPDAEVGSAASTKQAQIVDIDREAKTVTLSKNPDAALSSDSNGYGFVTVQNSYGREITGLGAIFDSEIPTLYGLTKAENSVIVPGSFSAGNDVDDMIITRAIRDSAKRTDANVDMVLCGKAAFAQFEEYMHATQHILVEKQKYLGGAVGYKIVAGNREAEIVEEEFIPDAEMWGVDTSAFEFRHTDWDFADYQSNIFVLMPGSSVYRALMANYGELICKNPGGCFKITDCGAAD